MTEKAYCRTAASLFGLTATLHLYRALAGIPASIGGWAVPLWLSWLSVAIGGGLAIAGWAARTHRPSAGEPQPLCNDERMPAAQMRNVRGW